MLITQSIEARAPQGDACKPIRLVVYKRESKAKERKGAERQRRSELYTIFKSRDCNCLPFTAVICRNLLFSASAVTGLYYSYSYNYSNSKKETVALAWANIY